MLMKFYNTLTPSEIIIVSIMANPLKKDKFLCLKKELFRIKLTMVIIMAVSTQVKLLEDREQEWW